MIKNPKQLKNRDDGTRELFLGLIKPIRLAALSLYPLYEDWGLL